MPERVPLRLGWDPESIRREVIDRAANVVFQIGSDRVRAAAVPLFRSTASGRLEQAIRIESSAGLTGAIVSIANDGGSDIDRVSICDGGFQHLFVPEVSTPTLFALELRTQGDIIGAPIVVEPQRKWSIHLVHHSHFDYGYTDPQPMVLDTHLRYLDAAVDLVDATADWPEDAKFRWNIEVTFPLRRWMANRPASLRDELIRQVKTGGMEIGALPFSMHTEAYSIDELAWGLRYAQQLRDEYGVEIVSAFQSDVPGAVIGLLTLLTDADVRYLTVAHNYAGRSVPFRLGGQDLTRPFWWKRADGRRLLVWYTDTPHGMAYMDGNLVGLAEGEATARTALPDYLAAMAQRPYPYGGASFGWSGLPADLPVTRQPYPHDILHFRIQSSIADNAPPSLAIPESVRDWNAAWAWPKMRLSRNRDFFELAEAQLGSGLDEFTGDWTDWWADGIGSGAYPLSLARRAQSAIRSAQSLHAAADVVSGVTEPQDAKIDAAYEAMALFDEHTWGSADPWLTRLEMFDSGDLQWHRKSDFAHEAHEQSASLVDAGIHRLAASFAPSPDAIASLLVFNQVGFERDALVRAFLPAERVSPETAFQLIDAATGTVLPYEIEPNPHPRFRASGQWVHFTAPALPSLGYARIDIVVGEQTPVQQPAETYRLRSPYYEVAIDPAAGFITSIVDRETGRELVEISAAHGFNEYIYDRYTSAPEFNHLSGRLEALDLSLLGERSTAGFAAVVARETTAVADRIVLRLVAPGADWLETTITLPMQSKQVLIENRLLKRGTLEKESVYFAFPFAIDDPDPEYAITGGVTSLDAPHVPGSVRHMLAIRDWVGMQDEHGSAAWVTVDAPLIELQNIAVPYAPFPNSIPGDHHRRSTIYSWALNNIWDTNFPPQQRGEMVFRYAIGSGPERNRRQLGIETAASVVSPPIAQCLRASDRPMLPARTSLLAVSNPLAEIVYLEPASDTGVMRAVLLSLAPEPVTIELASPGMRLSSVSTFLGQHPESPSNQQLTLHPGDYARVELVRTAVG